MLNLRTLAVATTLALTSWGAFAFPNQPATPRIDQREVQQDHRIHDGLRSGRLTPREAHRLERQQAEIRQAERRARADGRVTRQEREHIRYLQARANQTLHAEVNDRQQFRR
jgi:hypothetical protein